MVAARWPAPTPKSQASPRVVGRPVPPPPPASSSGPIGPIKVLPRRPLAPPPQVIWDEDIEVVPDEDEEERAPQFEYCNDYGEEEIKEEDGDGEVLDAEDGEEFPQEQLEEEPPEDWEQEGDIQVLDEEEEMYDEGQGDGEGEGDGFNGSQDEEEDESSLREADMSLKEIPGHLRETVESNMKVKRLLSASEGKNGTAAKQRKVDPSLSQKNDPKKMALLARWRAQGDRAVRYVLDTATPDEIAQLLKTNFMPKQSSASKTIAEQTNEQLIRNRERNGPHGGTLDVVGAFRYRWHLRPDDEKLLRTLNHKDLRFVIREYDGTLPIAEVVEQASMTEPSDEGKTADAAPDEPGLETLSRFNRLELIDPIADALVLGDANLTFSVILAQHRKVLGHVGRIVATTFENVETLRERYDEIDDTIHELEGHLAEVLHNVDCTRLAVDPRFKDMESKFGAVYYNFPHAGVVRGFFDGHPFVRWRHENLMQLFFRALRAFVKPGGVVKVSSNSGATGVRYSDIMAAAATNEFVHVETVPFLEWQLRGYRRSYGDRRDRDRRPDDGETYNNQKAHSDMLYSFSYAPTGVEIPELRIRNPPTKQDLLAAHEGKMKLLVGEAKKRKVEEIYKLFLSYVQGIHVG
mmetsp:Transcript_66398/g.175812  ORF Transcript_66398/g.175812 Transcript_66398/m.175812 type:complete len:634 (-) Transcript_66398:27-1928(-)